MRGTLSGHIGRYTRGRYDRGELSAASRKAHRYYLGTLDRSFGDRPLEQLGEKAIDRWLGSIRHLAASTRRTYVALVRRFCRWLIAEGLIRRDPTSHIGVIPQPRRTVVTFDEAEVQRVLAAAPDVRARAVLWLMVGCGCRCIEVSRLQLADYDPRAETIFLVGKGGHERSLPVPVEVAGALSSWLAVRGQVSGPLICAANGAGLAPATLSKYVRGWMGAAGVKAGAFDGRSAHGLRRTAGSDVMARCGDVQVVQSMLGHARIETTARYYLRAVSTAKLREAMEGRDYRPAA